MALLFLDTETFSEVNLLQTGSAKYARDPSTECLMLTWCLREGPVHYLELFPEEGKTKLIPFDLLMMLLSPDYKKVAHNTQFDKDILEFVLDVVIPIEQWYDSQAMAYALGFTGSLGAIQDAIGFSEDHAKIRAGKALINRFCKPAPKSHNADRYTKENCPEHWESFKQYAIRDTASMREMWNWCARYNPMSEYEWEAWRDTCRMNARGMPIAMSLVNTAIKLAALRKAEIKTEMIELTWLDNPNSVQQLLSWLSLQGVELPNLQAGTITDALASMPEGVPADVLRLRQIASQTAPSKWNSIKRMEHEHVVRGQFLYRGASRTARDASRGINLQNLRRPPEGEMDSNISFLYMGKIELIKLVFGEPLDFLARTVRGAITAPKGKKLVVSDLSSIESVVLGWLSNCRRMNQIFAEGKDTYKDYATELFHISYDEVTKKQRTFSKPPVLGAGYMMGGKGLGMYAHSMGVEMTPEESQRAVDVFRSVYPEIPALWRWIMDALEYTITSKKPCSGYNMTLYMDGEFLFITLPSGRNISYFQPLWKMWNTPIGEKMSFTYMGINRFMSSPTWERIAAHAGGVVENLVQAIARDVLIEWFRRCKHLHPVGRVHDEILFVANDFEAEEILKIVNQQAALPMPWAHDLLLKAEGFVTTHYTKD